MHNLEQLITSLLKLIELRIIYFISLVISFLDHSINANDMLSPQVLTVRRCSFVQLDIIIWFTRYRQRSDCVHDITVLHSSLSVKINIIHAKTLILF